MKCHQYWPDRGSCIYDNIKVMLHKEQQLTNYCVRQFFIEQVVIMVLSVCNAPFVLLQSQISGVKNKIRMIRHFHFTSWPDHGVPRYATPLLEFRDRVHKQHKRKCNKPMLVHCRYALSIHIITLDCLIHIVTVLVLVAVEHL